MDGCISKYAGRYADGYINGHADGCDVGYAGEYSNGHAAYTYEYADV